MTFTESLEITDPTLAGDHPDRGGHDPLVDLALQILANQFQFLLGESYFGRSNLGKGPCAAGTKGGKTEPKQAQTQDS